MCPEAAKRSCAGNEKIYPAGVIVDFDTSSTRKHYINGQKRSFFISVDQLA